MRIAEPRKIAEATANAVRSHEPRPPRPAGRCVWRPCDREQDGESDGAADLLDGVHRRRGDAGLGGTPRVAVLMAEPRQEIIMPHTEQRGALQRMDNIALVVDDLATARAYFTELGMELEGEATLEGSRPQTYRADHVPHAGELLQRQQPNFLCRASSLAARPVIWTISGSDDLHAHEGQVPRVLRLTSFSNVPRVGSIARLSPIFSPTCRTDRPESANRIQDLARS
ncbi:hypothetical protein [Prauserella shujinwangii]|uniref:hypothetical protein n=1 Tax=Prauserella shujinwangii TaxID=1453103 RepID=UPI001C633499|nr:hypothetical protein [Prauserella shujinwangii]